MVRAVVCGIGLMLLIAGCQEHASSGAIADKPAAAAASGAWPTSLRVVGDGFPRPGDPCRIIGESAATSDYLDDSATLAGCRLGADADRLGGRKVAVVDGVTLVSVPRVAAASGGDGDGRGDATVAGTRYNATAQIPCSGYRGAPAGLCDAGVQRGTGADGGSVIEIKLPGNRQRVLFFTRDHAFLTAGSAQSDGTAAYDARATRQGDRQIIRFGPERYEIPDVFLTGD